MREEKVIHHHEHLDTPKIAYLLNGFPCLSEIFILEEILELERQGIPLCIFALYKPSADEMAEEGQDVQASVTYIPHPRHVPHGTLPLLETTVRQLLKAPCRFLRTCIRRRETHGSSGSRA